MGKNRYQQTRFYLFANSYSGKRLIAYLKTKCNKTKLPQQIKRFAIVLDFNFRKVERLITDDFIPACPYKRFPKKLKIYLEIEKELLTVADEKLDEYSTALEDYGYKLLSPAIERVAGNSIKDMEDKEFERILDLQIKKYTYIYYRTAYKYKLPTLRIAPFLIRLISS